MSNSTIAVLGAGSWGTAIALHLAKEHTVLLWGRSSQHIQALQMSRENTRYLPGALFPPTLIPVESLAECVEAAQHIIIAVPSHAFLEILHQLPKTVSGLSWLTKGIDPYQHVFLSQQVTEHFGQDFPMAAISGPSFAKEVAHNYPTALVIASPHEVYAKEIRALFSQETIRVYLSSDLIGVQLCGAVKNILAIACGISDGLIFGANAKAALITRGLAEMARLGQACHADAATFMGLAGLGDLVLTCTDDQSRNRRFGLLLGKGIDISTAEAQIGQVVEGKHNAAQICLLAEKYQLELPICNQVNLLLQGKVTAVAAAKNLMSRPLGLE